MNAATESPADLFPRVTIPGSDRPAVYSGHAISKECEPSERATVTVCLRRPVPIDPTVQRSRESFAAVHSMSGEDVVKVIALAAKHTLTVISVDDASATIKLNGTVSDLEDAFGTKLYVASSAGGKQYRTRTGDLSVPDNLADIVLAVHGLDNRPVAKPKFHRGAFVGAQARVENRAAARPTPIYADELVVTYSIPAGNSDGTGVFVGIGSLGGGYKVSDLQQFCQARGLPLLNVIDVSVDGATNQPGDDADVENLLDLQTVIAILAKAGLSKASAVFFSAPNSSQGFLDCINAMTAWRDKATGKGLATASWSWGSSESTNTKMQLTSQDQAAAASVSQGLPVLSAAGDDGSSDGSRGLNVDFMGSSTHVISVGGTLLVLNSDGSRAAETVWGAPNDGATGGGLSADFSTPAYQSPLGYKMRAVPDLAANADPDSGYMIMVNGQWEPIGGTSGATPATAAALAVLSTYLGQPLGFLHPIFYANPAAFFDVASGSNGAYQAGPGFDLCSGLGVPNFTKLLAVLQGIPSSPPAPTPTPSPTPTPAPVSGRRPNRLEQMALRNLEIAGATLHTPARAGDPMSITF